MDSAYALGTHQEFTRSSAWWAFDFVNNWMQLNFKNMSQEFVFPLRDELETGIDKAREALEARGASAADLAAWHTEVQGATLSRWWKLADFLIMAYNDGFFNTPKQAGSPIGYPVEFMRAIGFNNDVHPIWVTREAPTAT